MKRLPFNENHEILAALDLAVKVLGDGGVAVVPTESYYGLAVDPRLERSVRAVHALKGRPADLGLPVVCADWQQVEELAVVPERYRVKLSRIWPAALTVILPARAEIPAAVQRTLAVRIPAHAALRSLLYRRGPLTATSANRHGKPPCVTIDEVLRSLTGEPDLALDGGRTPGGETSTLVDLTGDSPRLVRPGRVSWEEPYPEC